MTEGQAAFDAGPQQYLKVLSQDNQSCHRGTFDWTTYLPTADGPGQPLPIIADPSLCVRGWHWCTPRSLMRDWAKAHMTVYEAEPSSDVTALNESGKCVSSGGRLLRPYELPRWWLDAMRFVVGIADTPWLSCQGEPNPEWRLFTAPTLAAAGDAARDAAGAAVWDAAKAAARAAVRDAARDAARDAVWAAVRDAVWDAAGDAVWDAQLYALSQYICDGLDLDIAYVEHARSRWDVWQRGYGLIGDVGGVLYVYGLEHAS